MLLFIILAVVLFLWLSWKAGGAIFDVFTGTSPNKPSKDVYITKNYYDNRSVHFHAPEETKDSLNS